MIAWSDRLGPPKRLVLHRGGGRWRYAVYGESGDVLDGALTLASDAPAAAAQAELHAKVDEIAGTHLLIGWRDVDEGSWVGDIQR